MLVGVCEECCVVFVGFEEVGGVLEFGEGELATGLEVVG